MTRVNRLTNEELEEIRERAEKATEGNPLRDVNTLANMNVIVIEDIPKLLTEIERLREEIVRLRGMTGLSCPNCIEDCAGWVGHGIPCGKDW